VQLVEAHQLVDRPLVVVDTQVDQGVGQPRVPALGLHDEKRRGLLAAPVATGRLSCREAVEQPASEALSFRRGERLRECVDRFRADEDVALRRVAEAVAVTGPLVAPRTRPGRRVTRAVDDAELALVPAVVCRDELLERLLGGRRLTQQRQPFGPVAWVDVCLRRDRAHAGLGP
jgi:hypothetical protein